MKKGEIWLVELPSADGHEQIGTRPCIILAETEANIAIVSLSLQISKRFDFPIHSK
ncbi:type II toxin-antitoxin system PemK/MazF family toxin [Candidatus Woesearchaeota archaeon]|nr:type II toxin-antitoxin system PemK/MazF family toxin [Candidatus Woesearchaeota archaeon]